jgi:hypothetical protein
MTAQEALAKKRHRLQIFGATSDRSACTFAVPFSTQLAVVFRRGVTLMRRNPKARAVELGVAVVKALVVGIAFYDIGAKEPIKQMSYIFMMLQATPSARPRLPRRARLRPRDPRHHRLGADVGDVEHGADPQADRRADGHEARDGRAAVLGARLHPAAARAQPLHVRPARAKPALS